MRDNFLQRKKDILSKSDKSSIGDWDEKIKDLCEKINASKNLYTTSSCSGRIILMISQEKKEEGLYLAVSHDKISFDWLKENLNKLKNKKVKFKQEPCILHIACRDIESARVLYDKAKEVGWKKSGLISFDKRIILELNSTEKMEFPIIENGEILVSDNFLQRIVKESNQNLKKSWGKIEKLKNLLK